MKRRPYLALDISRLSKLVNANTQDKVLLEAVLFESQFRKTDAAKQLKRRVEQLMGSSDHGSKVTEDVLPPLAGLIQNHESIVKKSRKITEVSESMTRGC